MCNCIKEIEKKSFEVVKEQKKGIFSDGKLLQTHFPISKNQVKDRITYSEFSFYFAPEKKSGSIGKSKRQTVHVSHVYCPFCGEKHNNG